MIVADMQKKGDKRPLRDYKCEGCSKEFQKSFTTKLDGKILCKECKELIHKVRRKDKKRLTNYGLTSSDYNNLLEAQNGKCLVCKDKDFGGFSNKGEKFGLVVDHCHATGKVRGLLCSECNRVLGVLKDNPNTMISAIEYLARSRNIPTWNQYFVNLARIVATRSKDPSTKVGAVIGNGKRVVSTGYNGFPENIPDKEEWLNDREKKYSLTIHAEMNAIIQARKYGIEVEGCDIYVTLFPCFECAKIIVDSGIKSVKYLGNNNPRFEDSFKASMKLFDQVGITYEKVEII